LVARQSGGSVERRAEDLDSPPPQLLVDVLAAMDDPFVRWMLDRFDAEIVAVAKELP